MQLIREISNGAAGNNWSGLQFQFLHLLSNLFVELDSQKQKLLVLKETLISKSDDKDLKMQNN